MSGRPWSNAERTAVLAEYGRTPAAELAARLGRTVRALYAAAKACGVALRDRKRITPTVAARFRALHGAGLTDAEIARECGFDRHRIGKWRRSAGLPVRADGLKRVRRQSARTQYERLGIANFRGLRNYGQNKLAARYGLPPGLSTTHVRVVLMLAEGPKTKRQMCALLGREWPADGSRRVLKSRRNGSVPGDLVNLGLATSRRVYTEGYFWQAVYALTPKAIELLASAGKESA